MPATVDEPNPDDQPTLEADAVTRPAAAPPGDAALRGRDSDELREQARQLHEQAGDRARAAAELRDAAAELRREAAAPLPTPAADSSPRSRWFRPRG